MSFIVKLEEKYFEYSKVSDCPRCRPMSLESFTDWYLNNALEAARKILKQRLERVEETGTSLQFPDGDGFADEIFCDRSGKNETALSIEHFKAWCRGEISLRDTTGTANEEEE